MSLSVFTARGERKDAATATQPVPMARATTSTASIPNGAATPIPLGTEIYDTDNIHDLVTNTSRFTCRTPGVYNITGYVAMPGTAGQRYAYILYNGSVVLQTSLDTNGAGYYMSPSTQLNLNVGDYVEVAAFQNTGSTVTGVTGHLAMALVGLAVPTVPQGSLVTTLPSAPIDGQEVRYLADATNGVVWNLKYRAASSSAYKWEFIGGSSLDSYVAAQQSTTSTTYVSPTTDQFIVVPLAGDYTVEIGGVLIAAAAGGNQAYMSYEFTGLTAAADNWGTAIASPAVNNAGLTAALPPRRWNSLPAGVAVRLRHRTSSAGSPAYVQERLLRVAPIRVG
jgi:hypothetical protein